MPGKKDKLKDARKKVMNEIMEDLGPTKEEDDEITDFIDYNREYYNQQMIMNFVKDEIQRYVSENNIPIAEFLSADDIEEFLETIAA